MCTWNRGDKLGASLASIAASIARAPVPAEIVVVDNTATEAPPAGAAAFAAAATVPVTVVHEPAQGLSRARNRGLREAAGAVAAFTDDDCLVDRDWIGAIAAEFDGDPGLAVAGGRVDLHSAADRPISIRPLDARVRYASLDHVFALAMGCNMAVRRTVVDRLGGFDPGFGSHGVTGDDIDYAYRAWRAGHGVVFAPGIRVRHDHGRRSDDAVRRTVASYLRGRGAFYCKHAPFDRDVLRHAYWELRRDGGVPGQRRLLAAGAWHYLRRRALQG